ncbi:nicotinate-nucleotide adenylyltransferase [Rheinheimera maricola]|uniref:Probable nicotinate-nucleotide adenylyltransferase n=1 Tax=Rheinheimera maricola TaxID=2793282 RepID=A0ABS7XDZ9_9GAMM|nr:nicotinate-nucleotide adenylyltransferase [Rheinheimera maricola]MBZ9612928.1 nicotinate-nucleotide adenylyltransferase [Rheinheimera maricola]
MTKHIGIFGGTFNPVHNGHIACANFVQQHCALDEVRLMPCHLPPHRSTPGVSSVHRAAMVQQAIACYPQLQLESLELGKNSPSYTVDSLQQLHQRSADSQFYFIIGMDSLCYFRSWKDWQGILQLAHLLVCQRPGYNALSGDAPELLQHYGMANIADMRQQSAGGILLLHNPQIDLSASEIRQRLAQKQPCDASLATKVLNYIQTQQLYQT